MTLSALMENGFETYWLVGDKAKSKEESGEFAKFFKFKGSGFLFLGDFNRLLRMG